MDWEAKQGNGGGDMINAYCMPVWTYHKKTLIMYKTYASKMEEELAQKRQKKSQLISPPPKKQVSF